MNDEFINMYTKMATIESFWTRSTIPWKLSCDDWYGTKRSVLKRLDKASAASDEVSPDMWQPKGIMIIGGFGLFVSLIKVGFNFFFPEQVFDKPDRTLEYLSKQLSFQFIFIGIVVWFAYSIVFSIE